MLFFLRWNYIYSKSSNTHESMPMSLRSTFIIRYTNIICVFQVTPPYPTRNYSDPRFYDFQTLFIWISKTKYIFSWNKKYKYRKYPMFSDTLCFRTPPIFHRNNYFLAFENMFLDTLCFRTPPIFCWNNYFSVKKHGVITVIIIIPDPSYLFFSTGYQKQTKFLC